MLFRSDMFQDIEIAKEFLDIYLNKDIHQAVDWPTFRLYDTSLIGARGNQKYADVLYIAQLKDHPVEIFFMLNHERMPDELLGVKIDEYKAAVMRRNKRQDNKNLTFMISFTLYNGKQSPYPYSYPYVHSHLLKCMGKSVMDTLALSEPNLFDIISVSEHHLLDRSIHGDKDCSNIALASHGNVGIAELFMKHINDPDIRGWLGGNKELIYNLERSEHAYSSLDYLSGANGYEMKDLLSLFNDISPILKEKMITTRQQMVNEGIVLGIKHGEQLGIKKTARQMLMGAAPISKVQEWTGLSRKELEKLKKGGM